MCSTEAFRKLRYGEGIEVQRVADLFKASKRTIVKGTPRANLIGLCP